MPTTQITERLRAFLHCFLEQKELSMWVVVDLSMKAFPTELLGGNASQTAGIRTLVLIGTDSSLHHAYIPCES